MSKVHDTTCTSSSLEKIPFSKGTNCIPVNLEVHTAAEFDAPGTFEQSVQSVFYLVLFFQISGSTTEGVQWRRFLAQNAKNTLCLKSCNICLQEGKRMKVGLMSQ